MLKLFVLFIAFAVYGIHSLIAQLPTEGNGQGETSSAAPNTLSDKVTNGLAHYAGSVVGSAAQKVGLQVDRLEQHADQCQSANVDTQKLDEVIGELPEQQQSFFRDLLEKTPSTALPKWYQSDAAHGLCFQGLGIVVILPTSQSD